MRAGDLRVALANRVCVGLAAILLLAGCDAEPTSTPTAAPATALVPPPPPPPPPSPDGQPQTSAGGGGLKAAVGRPSGKLKQVAGHTDATVYTPDGVFHEDEIVAPWIMGMEKPRNPELDTRLLAVMLAEKELGGIKPTIEASQPVSINGMTGYEFITVGTPSNVSTPLVIYMCILYSAPDKYITIRGSAPKSAEAEWLPEFRAIANDWKKPS